MKKILFVNHFGQKCGVYQYGLNVVNSLKKTKEFAISYVECKNSQELVDSINKGDYWGVIYNYHELTLPFVDSILLKEFPKHIHICLAHELIQEIADQLDDDFFDYYIFADPTLTTKNPRVFKIGRLLPNHEIISSTPNSIIVGSYGFSVLNKQFEKLVELVQDEFDDAIIRINIPFNDITDKDGQGARACAEKCRRAVNKPGIDLQVTHHFFSQEELLKFLSENTINVFLYEELGITALSSAVDQAIALKRPIAVTDCCFFRHLFSLQPSIVLNNKSVRTLFKRLVDFIKGCIKRKKRRLFKKYVPSVKLLYWLYFKSKRDLKYCSLSEIINNHSGHLNELSILWSENNFVHDFEQILKKIEIVESETAANSEML